MSVVEADFKVSESMTCLSAGPGICYISLDIKLDMCGTGVVWCRIKVCPEVTLKDRGGRSSAEILL